MLGDRHGDHDLDRTSVDEGPLVARLKAGDEQAFEHLVRTFSGRLLAVARRMLGNEEDAKDALQNAFLSAFRSIDRFEGESQISTWLHRIVVNAALMKLRSRQRKPEEPIEPFLPQFLEDGHQVEPASPWQAPEQLLDREETRLFVRASIARLPVSYRTVLMLRDLEELSTEETAELLGITTNAVKIRLHRARQALGSLLNEACQTTPGTSKTARRATSRQAGRAGLQPGRAHLLELASAIA